MCPLTPLIDSRLFSASAKLDPHPTKSCTNTADNKHVTGVIKATFQTVFKRESFKDQYVKLPALG